MREPREIDLLVWDHFQHVGIYLGEGIANSTLYKAMKINPVKGYFRMKVMAYPNVEIER